MTRVDERIEKRIAKLVQKAGGRTFYVGGFVRDRILASSSISPKDVDIEVHGIEPVTLLEILSELGEPISYGESFGIYSLKGHDIDIAMPRIENAMGRGHRDFAIYVDPYLGTREAARRRDFTINALMEDVLSGEIVDDFNGLADLEKGIIRCVDPVTFIEDPLRVLRGAQFAARFNFTIDSETVRICEGIDLSALTRERVELEMKKALLGSKKPSIFFENLREMNQLDIWFPELKALIGLEQDPIYHPEGDVWTHTMEVIDRGAGLQDEVSDAYAFMLLCLTHDLGKIITSEYVNGRIHAYEHEIKGIPLVETLLDRLVGEAKIKKYVTNMVPLHMRPNIAAYSKPSIKSTNRMFDASCAPRDMIFFAMADKPVVSGLESIPFTGDSRFLFERLAIYEETMARPYVMGRDLVEAGLRPGEDFSEILGLAHKLRLARVDKALALKQALGYARELRKKAKRQEAEPEEVEQLTY